MSAAHAARRSFRNRPDLSDLRRAGAVSRDGLASAREGVASAARDGLSAAKAAGVSSRAVLPGRSRPGLSRLLPR